MVEEIEEINVDNRLKQRLIGVAVVVALAVIIIPELVKEPVGPGSPAVTTPIPPRPVQEAPKPPDVTISLPQAAPPPAPVAPVPSPAPEAEVPPPHTPAPTHVPPDAATQLKPERPVKPVDVTEPVNPAEAEAKARLAREEAAKAKAAKEAEAKARLAREEAAKVKAAKEAEAKPEVAKVEPSKSEPLKTEIRKPEAPKPEPPKPEVAKVEPSKPEPLKTEIRKPEPPKPVELPKLELIGRAGAPPVASAPASTARPDTNDRGWIVQAGSFSLPENANLLRDKLRSQRFDAFVERIAAGGRTLYRVRVGPRTSRAQSEAIAARMQREAGVAGQVVSLND